MSQFVNSTVLLVVILNPLALAVYLLDVFRANSFVALWRILVRAALISGAVFGFFAYSGSAIFQDVLGVRFAAFQVFGGVVFLIVALRFMLTGSQTLVALRGPPGQIAGAIAMPFLIGPGSVSAATLAGLRLAPLLALTAVGVALLVVIIALALLKLLFDYVNAKNAALVERYVDVASRASAMLVGTIAVEMTLEGLHTWYAAR